MYEDQEEEELKVNTKKPQKRKRNKIHHNAKLKSFRIHCNKPFIWQGKKNKLTGLMEFTKKFLKTGNKVLEETLIGEATFLKEKLESDRNNPVPNKVAYESIAMLWVWS